MKKLIVTNLILLCLLVNAYSQSIPSYVPSSGLVGWWPFNGNANDQSGNNNNGTVNGAVLTSDRFGNPNSAMEFNGLSDYITVADNSTLDFSNSLSFSAWVRIPDYSLGTGGAERSFLGKQRSNNLSGFNAISIGGAVPYYGFGLNNGPTNLVCNNGTALPLLTWVNIIGTYDGQSMKLYENGNLLVTIPASISLINSSQPLYIGKEYNTYLSGRCFKGQLDDIGMWNRPLTQQEITALYNAQSCTSNIITADGPTTFCAGNYVNLTSDVVGGSYQWKKNGVNISTNGTSRTYKATATGLYTCDAICNGTTLTSNAIQVTTKTNAFASLTASGASSFCAGDSVTLNCTNLGSNYSVQWYRTNVSIENATTYTQVVKQPGTYKVVTKNLSNGCSRISGSSVVVAVNCRLANPDVVAADITESDFDAVTREAEPKGKIYIYPNPASDNKFTVELMGLEIEGNATLEVYNAMGQILFSEKVNITNGTLNRTIQIGEQSKGQLCLVRLIAGSEVYDSKVILK